MTDPNSEERDPLDRVMVVGAHPDDPEFGCAGTVAKWANEGKEIIYVLLTSGDKGSHDPGLHPGQLATAREKEQRAAARELGVQEVIFLRHPDGVLQNSLDLRRELCGLIRRRRPHILMTIDAWRPYQLHPDHRAAGLAATDAIYAAREWHIFPGQLVDGVEPWRVEEAYLFWTDSPDHWEDISDTIDTRIAALMHHTSQVRDVDRLVERIRQWTQEMGQEQGYAHAEAFKKITFRRP